MGKPDLRKWLQIALGILPIVLAAKGVPSEITGAVIDGITEAEQIPGASGPEKKAHVINITKDAIDAVNGAAGKQKIDPARVTSLVSDGIDLGVRTVELVHDHTAEPNQPNNPHPEFPSPLSTPPPGTQSLTDAEELNPPVESVTENVSESTGSKKAALKKSKKGK